MKLEEYAIDDLHQMATAEFDDDPKARAVLDRAYQQMQQNYITMFQLVRSLSAARVDELSGADSAS